MDHVPLRVPVPGERYLQRTQGPREDNGFTGSSGACSDVLILWLLLGFAHGFGSDSWLGAGALAWLTLWLLVLNTGCDPRINTCSNLIRTPGLLFSPGFLAPGCFSNASSQAWTVVQSCMGKSFVNHEGLHKWKGWIKLSQFNLFDKDTNKKCMCLMISGKCPKPLMTYQGFH